MAMPRRVVSSSSRALVAAAVGALVLHGVPAMAAPAVQQSRGNETPVRLLAFGGLGGVLDPPGEGDAVVTQADGSTVAAGGAAHLGAYLAQLRQQAPHSLLLSTGDNVGAVPLPSAALQGEPVAELLNSWGVAASAVGAADLARGAQEVLRFQDGGCHPATGCAFRQEFPGADFPLLAANISTADGQPFTLPYVVRHVNNVPVGIIGVTANTKADNLPPGTVPGLRFGEEVEAVDRTAEALEFFGVKATVLLLHAEGDEGAQPGPNDCAVGDGDGGVRQIAGAVSPRVDIVFASGGGAAFNCVVRDPAGNERPLVHAASLGRTVAVADIVVDTATGEVLRDRTSAFNQVVTRDMPGDGKTQGLIDEVHRRTGDFTQQRLGEVAAPATRQVSAAGESTLGHLVADAQLAATAPDGAQLAFTSLGRLAADLDGGAATYGDVQAVHPDNRYLHTLTLTGQQLYGVLEEQFRDGRAEVLQASSNVSYRLDPGREPGMRIADLRVGEALVDKGAQYKVTVDSFLAAGGDGFATLRADAATRTRSTDVQALVSYLLANNPLAPPPADRISRP